MSKTHEKAFHRKEKTCLVPNHKRLKPHQRSWKRKTDNKEMTFYSQNNKSDNTTCWRKWGTSNSLFIADGKVNLYNHL